MSYKIKRDPADTTFSQYVRLRDKMCLRCLSPVKLNEAGLPVSHQASHFHGRRKESVRFDEQNVITLCGGCHSYFTAHPQEHQEWQLKRLGQKEYDALMIRANTPVKRDRKMSLLIAKQLLKDMLD